MSALTTRLTLSSGKVSSNMFNFNITSTFSVLSFNIYSGESFLVTIGLISDFSFLYVFPA